MYIIKYYDSAWGGWRRFDAFGDTAYPAEVPTLSAACEVAYDYLRTMAPATKAKVQITNAEGVAVTVINVRKRGGKHVETTA